MEQVAVALALFVFEDFIGLSRRQSGSRRSRAEHVLGNLTAGARSGADGVDGNVFVEKTQSQALTRRRAAGFIGMHMCSA
jgi:hypothetical protein